MRLMNRQLGRLNPAYSFPLACSPREVPRDTNLGHGTCRFNVIACNSNGVWNNEGATLEFTIAPSWFQKTWFLIVCGIVIVLILWVHYPCVSPTFNLVRGNENSDQIRNQFALRTIRKGGKVRHEDQRSGHPR